MVNDVINKQDLLEKIRLNNILFLDFYAIWCGPCVAFSPIYEKISDEFLNSAKFLKINVDEQRDIAVEYRISSIPTIICLKNGIVCWSNTGNLTEESLREKVKNIIEKEN